MLNDEGFGFEPFEYLTGRRIVDGYRICNQPEREYRSAGGEKRTEVFSEILGAHDSTVPDSVDGCSSRAISLRKRNCIRRRARGTAPEQGQTAELGKGVRNFRLLLRLQARFGQAFFSSTVVADKDVRDRAVAGVFETAADGVLPDFAGCSEGLNRQNQTSLGQFGASNALEQQIIAPSSSLSPARPFRQPLLLNVPDARRRTENAPHSQASAVKLVRARVLRRVGAAFFPAGSLIVPPFLRAAMEAVSSIVSGSASESSGVSLRFVSLGFRAAFAESCESAVMRTALAGWS